MTDSLISIVVPIYNAERTLARCVDSVLVQTYSAFELLLINDGSCDQSEEIALSCCAKDNRVKYFPKENGGVSSARNLGIEKALGKYICFIDSDDTVNEDYLRLLYENIQGSDVSIGNVFVEGQQMYNETRFFPGRYSLAEFKKDIKNALNHVLLNSPWNKLFRTDIIVRNELRFDTAVKMGEDLLFNLAYFDKAEFITVFDEIIYNYLLNDTSVTKNYKPEYYQQRRMLVDRQIKFFELEDNTALEKQVLKVNLLLGLINNEIIENPARKADKATFKALLDDNDLYNEIAKIRIPLKKLAMQNRRILLLKLGLYGLYISRLRKK